MPPKPPPSPFPPRPTSAPASDSEEEEDYLTMALPTSTTPAPTSSLHRARAKRAAAAQSSTQPTKRAREADSLRRLERGLGGDILTPSTADDDRDAQAEASAGGMRRGAALMAKLGYTGGALGRRSTRADDDDDDDDDEGKAGERSSSSKPRRPSPIRVSLKHDRAGIGAAAAAAEDDATARARRDVAAQEARAKALREDAGDFRVRMAREKAEKVAEGRGRAAGRVGETLYAQMASGGEEKTEEGEREVPVFVRAVRAEQRAKEERMARGREKAARLARMEVQGEEGGEGLDDDEADVVARGETVRGLQGIGDGEDEEEDAELEEFLTLSAEERLERTVRWLRQEFHYCFWCKAQYDDEEMEGCPGVGEEVHG